MIIRLFYHNSVKDIPIYGNSSLTIGSGQENDISIPDSDLLKRHVSIIQQNNTLTITGLGNVYLQGTNLSQPTIMLPQDTFVLSTKYKISLFVKEEYVTSCQALQLKDFDKITVGRGPDNVVTINSHRASKRHAVIQRVENVYQIQDCGSTNGIYVNGQKIQNAVLDRDDEIVLGDVDIRISDGTLTVFYDKSKVHLKHSPAQASNAQPAVFTRSPRLKLDVLTGELDIAPPPAIGGKPELNWVALALPALTTVGLALVIALAMSNPMMLLYTLPMTASGMAVSLYNYRRQTKGFAQQTRARLDTYAAYLDITVKQIQKSQQQQLAALTSAAPDTDSCFSIVRQRDRRLWERRPQDQDFLSLRLGSGEVDSSLRVNAPREELSLEDDELKRRPQAIAKRYRQIQGAPILCDMLRGQVCGIVGSRRDALRLLNNMTVQFATLHCYTESKAVFLCDEMDKETLGWVQRLPHTSRGEGEGSYAVFSREEASRLLQDFSVFLKNRRQELEGEDNSYGKASIPLPYYLFVIGQPAFLGRNDPINQYLFQSRNLGVGVILVVEEMVQLPKECNLIVEIKGDQGVLYHKDNAARRQKFQVDSAEPDRFRTFSQRLSRITCDEEKEKQSLPKQYTLFQMLGLSQALDYPIAQRWRPKEKLDSLSAPLGVGESGQLISLDLHERAHGPHGLVAGTTGSGKSEILQTYILSMALRYRPDDVGFVIIDFKGGGMANQFAYLPHLLGAITNIEGREIDRSLASIRAELLKRQRLFAEQGVNNIDKYIEAYRQRKTPTPLPHLLLIVDEFAELKAEQPEFMKELISAARIGRSLGVHLILATQKPSGQVNEQIWSNSRFRLCLKVATREDSSEVLKSPVAFRIKEPGRAYLQVGNNEVFELFQSAYSGAEAAPGRSQLEAVVDRIACYCQEQHIQRLPSICLPALPEILKYEPLVKAPMGTGITALLGWYDAPDCQEQGELSVNLTESNLIVIGSPQSGKTNLLQTILRDLSERYSSDQVNLYIIDFGSMLLKNFETLNHVGGVAVTTEEEKLENLFKLLIAQVTRRKERFAAQGVSSYPGYLDAGLTDLPQIVLLIDNLTILQELYPQTGDQLLALCREGLSAGISVVAANAQTSGISLKLLLNFSKRIALYCNDSGEYSNLFDRSRLTVGNLPGRGLTEIDHQILEVQMYLSFQGEREIDRVNDMRRYVDQANRRNQGKRAVPIPVVPELVTLDGLSQSGCDIRTANWRVPLGMDYADMSLFSVDLWKTGLLAIAGGEGMGKTNLILHILDSIQSNIFDNLSHIYLADGAGELEPAYDYGCVRTCTENAAEAKTMIEDVYTQLQERKAACTNNRTLAADLESEPLLLLVLSDPDILAQLLQDKGTGDKLLAIAKELKKYKACVLLSNLENEPIGYSAPALLKYVKETNSLFVLEDIANIRLLDIPLKLQREYAKELRPGDGFSFLGGKVRKIRTILRAEQS